MLSWCSYNSAYKKVMNQIIINHMIIGIIIYHDYHLKPTMLSSWRDLKMLFSSLHWLHKDWMHTIPETWFVIIVNSSNNQVQQIMIIVIIDHRNQWSSSNYIVADNAVNMIFIMMVIIVIILRFISSCIIIFSLF